MTNILVTGGVRSGKSRFAQELAVKSAKAVLFVATAEAGDDEMRLRIEEHRRSRPADWDTLEVTSGVGKEISRQIGNAQLVIVDCVTMLVSNLLGQYADRNDGQIEAASLEKEVIAEIDRLIDCFNRLEAGFIIVTNEVGSGLVPDNELGRIYRDLLGKANQMLAGQVDRVYLMVAGLPVLIKPFSNLDGFQI